MTRRWSVLAVLAAGLLLPGCAPPPPAPAAAQTASAAPAAAPAAPAAAPASPTADPVAVTSSPPAPGPDQSYLEDLRRKEPTLVKVPDATLVAVGKDFCAQVRAGIPARYLMQKSVEEIAAKYQSGQISEALQNQMGMAMADTDETATFHYCPEQMTQVMAAFAAMATGH